MFTYRDYYDLLTQAFDNNRKVYLRHHVDISVKKAVELAEREYRMSVGPGIYFILTTSEFYNPFNKDNTRRIKQILDMGHRIGLHYDSSILGTKSDEIGKNIAWHANVLGEHFDTKITAISQHMPRKNIVDYTLIGELQKLGLNDPMITLKDYMYIADSGMMFYEDPYKMLDYHRQIHFNLHPEWWAETEGTVEDRLIGLKLDTEIDTKVYKRIIGISERNERVKNPYNRDAQGGNDKPSEIL